MCKGREGNDTILAKRGMVFFVEINDGNEDTKNGTIMTKCRPCVIASVDEKYNNSNPRRYTIIPVTSRDDAVIFEYTEVLFKYKGDYKVAVVDSVKSVSMYDIKANNYAYTLNEEVMKRIDDAIDVHFGHKPYDVLDLCGAILMDYN